jgi:hypothetical protein
MAKTKRCSNKSTHTKRVKYTKRVYKGGLFESFMSRQPITTHESLEILLSEVGNIKLKKIESIISEEITRLASLRTKCVNDCKKELCSKDEIVCTQINKMMSEKPDYEWNNVCNNSDVSSCKEYSSLIKKVDFYVNFLKTLSDKSQKMLSDYKTSITKV